MPRGATARLVASINQRVTGSEQQEALAGQVVRAMERRHKQELADARGAAQRSSLAVYETRRGAFEELLQFHGVEQCSLCLQEVTRSQVKLICRVHPQSYAYNSPLKKLPDWTKDAQLLRICPECMGERRRGAFTFLDMGSGYITNSHSEMSHLWFPVRLKGEVWEIRCDKKWQPIPESAIKGYFEYEFQVNLVLTVARRLGWKIEARVNTWGEYRRTRREEYAGKLAEQRRKQREERRRQRYCDRCSVYHTGRCPKRPRQIFGARAA